jgi:hypothetical protein
MLVLKPPPPFQTSDSLRAPAVADSRQSRDELRPAREHFSGARVAPLNAVSKLAGGNELERGGWCHSWGEAERDQTQAPYHSGHAIDPRA